MNTSADLFDLNMGKENLFPCDKYLRQRRRRDLFWLTEVSVYHPLYVLDPLQRKLSCGRVRRNICLTQPKAHQQGRERLVCSSETFQGHHCCQAASLPSVCSLGNNYGMKLLIKSDLVTSLSLETLSQMCCVNILVSPIRSGAIRRNAHILSCHSLISLT